VRRQITRKWYKMDGGAVLTTAELDREADQCEIVEASNLSNGAILMTLNDS